MQSYSNTRNIATWYVLVVVYILTLLTPYCRYNGEVRKFLKILSSSLLGTFDRIKYFSFNQNITGVKSTSGEERP